MISREEAHRLLRYEAETGIFFWRVNKGRRRAGDRAGWIDDHGYVKIMIEGHTFSAHRLAWLMTHGVIPNIEIDHRNGDKSDNRLTNLRLATHAQNGQNRRIHKNNKTGFKRVSVHGAKFQASIVHEGRQIHLGTFSTPEDAHDAYCKAASELFGEFARAE